MSVTWSAMLFTDDDPSGCCVRLFVGVQPEDPIRFQIELI